MIKFRYYSKSKKIRDKLTQSGYTLGELLVVMVIMGVLSLTLANFIVNWLKASSLASSRANLLTNAETALDTISDDIKLSGAADLNNRWPDDNGPSGDQFGWASGSQELVLAKAAVDNSNTILFSDPAKYISQKDNEVYYLSGSTLYRRTITSDSASDAAKTTCPPALATPSCPADTTIATGVTSIAFTYFDANENSVTPSDARSVQIAITLTSTTGGETATANYATRMVFRNE